MTSPAAPAAVHAGLNNAAGERAPESSSGATLLPDQRSSLLCWMDRTVRARRDPCKAGRAWRRRRSSAAAWIGPVWRAFEASSGMGMRHGAGGGRLALPLARWRGARPSVNGVRAGTGRVPLVAASLYGRPRPMLRPCRADALPRGRSAGRREVATTREHLTQREACSRLELSDVSEAWSARGKKKKEGYHHHPYNSQPECNVTSST